jgi:hypothetical protein
VGGDLSKPPRGIPTHFAMGPGIRDPVDSTVDMACLNFHFSDWSDKNQCYQ